MPGGWELLLLLAVVLLIFGTRRIKTLGSDLGSAIKGFRKSMGDAEKGDSGASDQATEVKDESENSDVNSKN